MSKPRNYHTSLEIHRRWGVSIEDAVEIVRAKNIAKTSCNTGKLPKSKKYWLRWLENKKQGKKPPC